MTDICEAKGAWKSLIPFQNSGEWFSMDCSCNKVGGNEVTKKKDEISDHKGPLSEVVGVFLEDFN